MTIDFLKTQELETLFLKHLFDRTTSYKTAEWRNKRSLR